MTQQYDEVAKSYDAADDVVRFYREQVEYPSFQRALGPVRGKRVLDVGCGEGSYTRMIKRQGASEIIGVDLSEGMVERAREIEARQPLGIEYHVHDVATMPVLGTFDVVAAAHVLHYADSRESLENMSERFFAHLAPGGRLLAFVGNVHASESAQEASGFQIDRPDQPCEADPYTISIRTTPRTSFQVHYWPSETVARVLEATGFTAVTWEPMEGSPTGDDPERARRCTKNPVNLLLSARKA
ncbi:methyltransferase domain-containing protein [Streptomyces sp. NPDC051162]|uniref:class I SAM-dependent methyltransferase n=1 Tax=Streptomyces sp. NPDC051162 TaxID=3154747 RepID=UPI00343C216D